MTADTVVIATPLLHSPGPHWPLLHDAGFAIGLPPEGFDVTKPDQLVRAIAEADGVVAGTEPYTREVMLASPRLRVIVRCGAGYDAIDVKAADELGIAVATTAGTNHEAVAEHALAMLLALARGFPQRDRMVRRSVWEKTAMPRFSGKTLGLIGLGRSAQALVRLVSGMHMRILAAAPRPDRLFAEQHGVRFVELDDLLRESDFVSLHVPLTGETQNLIESRRLALMKPGAVLVNVARGGLVEDSALHAALSSGRLGGAGLDVFAAEPCTPGYPLLELDNVLLSPHVAGLDNESFDDARRRVAEVLIELRAGIWPHPAVVNLRENKIWRW